MFMEVITHRGPLFVSHSFTFVCLCICGIQTVQSTLVSFMFCTDCCSVASHLQDDGDVEDDMTIREVRCTTSPSNESVRDQRVVLAN